MNEEDRKQIGVTPAGQAALDRLTKTLRWFDEGQDAGRFALALAVRRGVGAGQVQGVETRWSQGSFDPDGEILSILRAVYPDSTTPIRLMEHLIDEGLKLVVGGLDSGEEAPIAYLS